MQKLLVDKLAVKKSSNFVEMVFKPESQIDQNILFTRFMFLECFVRVKNNKATKIDDDH